MYPGISMFHAWLIICIQLVWTAAAEIYYSTIIAQSYGTFAALNINKCYAS